MLLKLDSKIVEISFSYVLKSIADYSSEIGWMSNELKNMFNVY